MRSNDSQAGVVDNHTETEHADMGRVTIAAEIINNFDLGKVAAGELAEDAVRRIEVADAVIDTGATSLYLSASLIQSLGLRPVRQNQTMTIYSDVLIKIFDREAVVRVVELPEGLPALIGQIPLEEMDLIVHPLARTLVPNPAHGGEWTLEVY